MITTKGMAGALIISLMLTPSAFAKRCGNSHIPDWKTCHVGVGSSSAGATNRGSSSTGSGSYGTGGGSYGQYGQSPVTYGTYGQQTSNLPIKSGETIRRAEIRTCAIVACTVIGHYPSGTTVRWSVVNNGFVNIQGTGHWVKLADIITAN